jgi:hypothetical protein
MKAAEGPQHGMPVAAGRGAGPGAQVTGSDSELQALSQSLGDGGLPVSPKRHAAGSASAARLDDDMIRLLPRAAAAALNLKFPVRGKVCSGLYPPTLAVRPGSSTRRPHQHTVWSRHSDDRASEAERPPRPSRPGRVIRRASPAAARGRRGCWRW